MHYRTRKRLQQMVGLLFGTVSQINMNVQLGAEQGGEPIFFHYILEEVVFKHLGNPRQQIDVDAGPVENGVNIGPLAMDLPGKLRNGHVFLVKNGFYSMAYMKLVLTFHHKTVPIKNNANVVLTFNLNAIIPYKMFYNNRDKISR